MLKLILFAPTEQLLLGQGNAMSLISVLENVAIGGEILKDIPANAAVPKQWTGVALWARTEDVPEPIKFVARMELAHPDGKTPMGGNVEFTVSNAYLNFRNTMNFQAFPIGQPGTHVLRLLLKRADREEFELKAEFPIYVIHQEEEATDENKLDGEALVESGSEVEAV